MENEGDRGVQMVLDEALDGYLRVSIIDSEGGSVFYLKTKEVSEPPAFAADPTSALVLMPAKSFCMSGEKMKLGMRFDVR